MSARISTKNSVTMAFGKVEVRAKLPRGDWLWPAIWMLPKDSVYGDWPLSGEIDVRHIAFYVRASRIDYMRTIRSWRLAVTRLRTPGRA